MALVDEIHTQGPPTAGLLVSIQTQSNDSCCLPLVCQLVGRGSFTTHHPPGPTWSPFTTCRDRSVYSIQILNGYPFTKPPSRSLDLLNVLRPPLFPMFLLLKSLICFALHTTITHEQLKSRLSGLIRITFICKNGSQRYKYVVVKNNNANLFKMESTLQINIQRLILFE